MHDPIQERDRVMKFRDKNAFSSFQSKEAARKAFEDFWKEKPNFGGIRVTRFVRCRDGYYQMHFHFLRERFRASCPIKISPPSVFA